MLYVDELLPDETIIKKIKSKGFRLYFFSFVVAPVSYGIKIIVSNNLPVADVGLIYSLLGFVGIISVYNDLGLTDALQYFIPKYVLQKESKKIKGLMSFTLISQLVSGVLLGGGLIILSQWLSTNYFHSPEAGYLLKFFGLYFLVINFFQVLQSFYFALQHVKLEKLIEFLRMFFVLATTVLLRKSSLLSINSFAIARFVGLLIATVISILVFYKKYYSIFLKGETSYHRYDIKKRIAYGFWSLIGANAWTIISQIDLQFVIYYFGKEMAGYRTNYMSLNSLSTFVFIPLLSFTFPVFTELIEKKQFNKLHYFRKMLLRATVVYGIILGLLIHFFGIEIGQLVFGDNYTLSGELLQYTAFLLFTPLLGIINFQYIRSFGKVKQVTLAQIAVLIIHIAISLGIIYYTQNIYYLALSLLISHLLFFVVTQIYITKKKL